MTFDVPTLKKSPLEIAAGDIAGAIEGESLAVKFDPELILLIAQVIKDLIATFAANCGPAFGDASLSDGTSFARLAGNPSFDAMIRTRSAIQRQLDSRGMLSRVAAWRVARAMHQYAAANPAATREVYQHASRPDFGVFDFAIF